MEIKKKKETISLKNLKFYALYEEKEVGYAYLFFIFNQTGGYFYGLLEDVFVKEEYRKQGLGTQLVQAVIEECRTQGLDHLIATSRYSRSHVHIWYQKVGFKDYGKEFRMDFI